MVHVLILLSHVEVRVRIMEVEIFHRGAPCVTIGFEGTGGAYPCCFGLLPFVVFWANI